MIKLFRATDKIFTSNGITTIKPIKLIEKKKIGLNGWELDVELDLKHKDLIEQDMLAVVQTKSKQAPQAFRINNIEYTQRKMSFTAHHVVFDAHNYYLVDARPTNMSAIGALNYVNERTDNKSPFNFTSDVNSSSTAYFIRKNLLEALTVIEERWGGYFEADNWNISLKKNVGHDRDMVVSYGKNLESIQVTEDWSNVVTRLYPVGFDGLTIPGNYIESKVKYDKPYTKTVRFETEYEDEDRTNDKLLSELIENAHKYIEKNQYPMVNYEVKSNINDFMEIGDLIHVKHPLVDIQTRVQEYTYNIVSKRVESLVFGNYSRDVKKRFDAIKDDIKSIKGSSSNLEALVGHQTDLINSLNKEGHLYIDENQMMVLDKLPMKDAKNVWRWNLGGLGFSENGIEGPFKQAWTIDGKFNTDFIAANSIMTNQLHSDVGSSLDLSSNHSITAIVNQLANLNSESNLIINLVPTIGTTMWKFDGGKRALTSDSYLFEGGKLNNTFIPIQMNGTLSQWAKSFYVAGSALSPKGYVVEGYDYSYRAKRYRGSQSITIKLHEYTHYEQETATRVRIMYSGKDEIMEFTTQLDKSTNFVSLEFITDSDVTISNRLIIADDMFNRGNPKLWEQSAEEVKIYAETRINQLDDEVSVSIDKINHTDKKINNSTVKITAEMGVEIWNNIGKGLTVYGDDGMATVELTSGGTIRAVDAEFVNATITGNLNAGTIANLDFDETGITFPNGKLKLDSLNNNVGFGQGLRMEHSTFSTDFGTFDVAYFRSSSVNDGVKVGVERNSGGQNIPFISVRSIYSSSSQYPLILNGMMGDVAYKGKILYIDSSGYVKAEVNMELDANKVIEKLWDKIKALTFQIMVLEDEIERLRKGLNKE